MNHLSSLYPLLNRGETDYDQNLFVTSLPLKGHRDLNTKYQGSLENEESFLRLFEDRLKMRDTNHSHDHEANNKTHHVSRDRNESDKSRSPRENLYEVRDGNLEEQNFKETDFSKSRAHRKGEEVGENDFKSKTPLDTSRTLGQEPFNPLAVDLSNEDVKNLKDLELLKNLEVLKNQEIDQSQSEGYSFFIAKERGFIHHLGQKLELKPWQVIRLSNQWNQWGEDILKNLNHLENTKWNEIMSSLDLTKKEKDVAYDFMRDFFKTSDSSERKFSFLPPASIGSIGGMNKKLSQNDLVHKNTGNEFESIERNVKDSNLRPLALFFPQSNIDSRNGFDKESMKKLSSPRHLLPSETKQALNKKGHFPFLNEMGGESMSLDERKGSLSQGEDFSFEESFLDLRNLGSKNHLSASAKPFGELQVGGSVGLTETKESSDDLNSIVQKIQWISETKGEGALKIHLKPLELGELLLQVSNVNNKVHVKLLAESVEAKKQLQSSLFDLKEALHLKNVKVDQIMIGSLSDVSGGDFNPSSQKEGGYKLFGDSSGFLSQRENDPRHHQEQGDFPSFGLDGGKSGQKQYGLSNEPQVYGDKGLSEMNLGTFGHGGLRLNVRV